MYTHRIQLKHPVQYWETNRQDILPVLESCSENMKKQNERIWKQQLNYFLVLWDFSVETNRKCLSFLLFRCDWSKELVSLSQPIRSKMKTNGVFATRRFPRFKQFACFYMKFLLAPFAALLSSDWLLWLIQFWFNGSQSKCAPYGSNKYIWEVQSSMRFLL